MTLETELPSMTQRDESGRFEKTVSEQDILKVFDAESDPVLTASEVAEQLEQFGKTITPEGVWSRLDEMDEKGLVSRKQIGANADGWRAEVAPELAEDTAETVEEQRQSAEWEEL